MKLKGYFYLLWFLVVLGFCFASAAEGNWLPLYVLCSSISIGVYFGENA